MGSGPHRPLSPHGPWPAVSRGGPLPGGAERWPRGTASLPPQPRACPEGERWKVSTHFSARWFPAGGRSVGRRRRGLSARRCPRKALSSARGQKAVGRGRGTPGALRPCCARGRAGPTPPHSGPCRPPAHSPAFLPWGPCPRSRTGRGAGRRQRRAGGRPGRCGLAVTTRLRCSRRLVVPCFSRCSGGEAFEEDLFNWEKNQSGGDGRSGGGRGCWDRARRGPSSPCPAPPALLDASTTVTRRILSSLNVKRN